METTKVKITWKAFGNKPERGKFITSIDFELPKQVSNDEAICNAIYKATNLQGELADFGASNSLIKLWEIIESQLSPIRTHTSLSIGDEIAINGQTYICAELGWVKPEDAEIKYLPSEYGEGSIFSVRAKAGVS